MRVILLAGGKGTRLYPYTVAIPKPLVPVGNLPIMEIIIDQLKRTGVRDITISIGHLGDIIRAFIGDGTKFGVRVSYLQESTPLGTVGPLKQLKDLPERFILMNGDILTDLDYAALFAAHAASGADVLIASHRKKVPIDLGILECRDNVLVDYREKPIEQFDVSMGIYAMHRRVVEYIPENTYFDFPTLIQKLLDAKRPVHAWPYSGHWLDLGSPTDYERAQGSFRKTSREVYARKRKTVKTYMLSDLVLGRDEEQAVARVLQSRWLSMGPETAAFEKEFQEFAGSSGVVATSSCTAALHLALLAIGVGPGDEVIVPALTFVATANSVLYTGAMPVFVDITSLSAPLLDPTDLERKMTSKTKAVIVMHYAGYPCDMDRILDICRKRKIRVIEDAAHCAGSKYKGRFCGVLGDIGCFSLFANKNLPAGEGGVLISNDETFLAKSRRLRSHGMTSLSWDRSQGHASGYDVTDLGFNYRMPELSAAIARAQLRKIDAHNAIRNRLFARYVERLQGETTLTVPFIATLENDPGSRHLMPILLKRSEDRPAFQEVLKNQGIQTSVHYPPVYSFSYFRSKPKFKTLRLPITEDFAGRVVTLPFHPALSEQDVDHICETVLRSLPGRG